jgi:hypothetical protein
MEKRIEKIDLLNMILRGWQLGGELLVAMNVEWEIEERLLS